MTITVENLVSREVHYCVSSLVAGIAETWHADSVSETLDALHEQAQELSCPIDDWESAAREAGWRYREGESGVLYRPAHPHYATSWQDACEHDDIEPHQREVYEHWIVSDWLADELEAHGEKVDKDFAGLTVWARTTSGQGIASDSVIIAIHADLVREA